MNKNKVKYKISGDIRIELMDYEKNWVKKIDLKDYVYVIFSIFSFY